MAALHIQIVEGNPHLRSLLGWHLQQAGHIVHLASGIQLAQDGFNRYQPDLVIVDAELPNGDGLTFCRWLQQHHHPMVLLLSAQANETDVVVGLKAGADDYLTKPFGMQEFLARVTALGRRSRSVLPSRVKYGDLCINVVQRRVHYNQEPIDLTPQEFSLLYVLTQANGNALSRLELLKKAWPDNIDNPRTVDTHILSLRKKIELEPQHPQLIQTVRNVGYRLNLEFLLADHPQRGWAGSPEQFSGTAAKRSSPRPALVSQPPPKISHASYVSKDRQTL